MNDTVSNAVCSALDYLRNLSREDIQPDEALHRIQHLRAQHPEARFELLWEEESCDRSIHYDTLVHCNGEGTVSVSLCPEKTLPWPLRGVQRWSEMDLLRVNATILKVDQAVALLDFIWDEAPILNRLMQACLIRESLENDPVEISDEELQRAMDAFRRSHRLYKTEDMLRWMERRGLSYEKLERHVSEHAQVTKLRERVTSGRVESYFAEHRADFDSVAIAKFNVADATLASQIIDELNRGKSSFYEVAERCFLSGSSKPSDLQYIIRRNELEPLLKDAFATKPGTVIGPVAQSNGYLIGRVLSNTPASLDEATRRDIEQLLFDEWLEAKRQDSVVEWYWGRAS